MDKVERRFLPLGEQLFDLEDVVSRSVTSALHDAGLVFAPEAGEQLEDMLDKSKRRLFRSKSGNNLQNHLNHVIDREPDILSPAKPSLRLTIRRWKEFICSYAIGRLSLSEQEQFGLKVSPLQPPASAALWCRTPARLPPSIRHTYPIQGECRDESQKRGPPPCCVDNSGSFRMCFSDRHVSPGPLAAKFNPGSLRRRRQGSHRHRLR